MNKEFIPYEQELEMKDLGYVAEPIVDSWRSLTLYQQAFRWFRENYPYLDFGIGKIHNGTNNYHYHINLEWEFFEGTYEEAELACLKKLIEMVKLSK